MLIHDRCLLGDLSTFQLQEQVPIVIQAHFLGARNIQPDTVWVGAGRDHEVEFQLPLVAAIAALLFSGLIGWPLVYLLRQPRPAHTSGARAARWLAATTALLVVCSLAVTAVELSADLYDYAYGVPTAIAILLQIQYLTAALVIGMVGFTVAAWRRGWWTLPARFHYTAVTLAMVALIPLLIYWRILGYGF